MLASITLLTLDFRGDTGALDGVRDGALDALAPVRRLADGATQPVRNAWNGAFDYDDVRAENAELRARIEELESEELLVAELQRELDEARALLEVTGDLELATVGARVIDAPISDFERNIEIDVGTGDGIAEGMPVLGPGGLVGRVVQVTGSQARVQLLSDGNFGVGVRLTRSGETGVAVGRGRTQPLEIELLDVATVVIPGETVTTSGQEGSAFPPGLLVGTVSDAVVDTVDGVLRVTLVPAADLNRLDVVSVVLWPPPTDAPDDEGPR
ncbi:MAG: rod shape-determining protein MreC [Actinomycetota bacterium]